jgi:hypothetical protein
MTAMIVIPLAFLFALLSFAPFLATPDLRDVLAVEM